MAVKTFYSIAGQRNVTYTNVVLNFKWPKGVLWLLVKLTFRQVDILTVDILAFDRFS
jgi:hypothetical protein